MTINIINNKNVEQEEFLACFLGKTIEEAEETHKEFSPLLNIITRNYSLGTGLEKADLFGEALVGLARAKRDFDSTRNENFKTFAVYKIKDALNKFVRENMCSVSIPSYVNDANNLINKLRDLLDSQNIEYPSIEEAISKGSFKGLELSFEAKSKATKIVALLKKAASRASTTYSKLVSRAGFLPNDREFDDFCVSEENNTVEKVLVDQIWQIMDDTDREIGRMIMEDKSKSEIATRFGKSITWVNNRLKKIKERIT